MLMMPVIAILREFTRGSFAECSRHAAAGPQTELNDLGCESACGLLPFTPTIALYYYYSTQKLILILPCHG